MWQTRIFFCTWQQNVTPIMQPFHCDLQLPKHPLTTHTRTTTRCRTQRRNRFGDETSAAAPAAHTRYLASLAAATLHRKTQGFRAPASSPKESPCKIHAAITIRFAAPPTHSRSHYNAFLQLHVANPHLSLHMATEHGNNDAAITLRSATRDSTSA